MSLLEGIWYPVKVEKGGKPFPKEKFANRRMTIRGHNYVIEQDDTTEVGAFIIYPNVFPLALDIKEIKGPDTGVSMPGIYEVSGDRLRICYDSTGNSRPVTFSSEGKSDYLLVTYEKKEQ